MDAKAWIGLVGRADGRLGQLVSAIDKAFRLLVGETVRCEEERDHERGDELDDAATELQNTMSWIVDSFHETSEATIVIMDGDDLGQILDGIIVRRDAYQETLSHYLGAAVASSHIEEVADADEAACLVARYDGIIWRLTEQLDARTCQKS
ncbi:MAG: hypothetical protein HN341_03045 [Verrucomicrobia bacterium]|jgi:hypothetical protein|nr:hypothetical protein [Verrucomicrobiota bacterium]